MSLPSGIPCQWPFRPEFSPPHFSFENPLVSKGEVLYLKLKCQAGAVFSFFLF